MCFEQTGSASAAALIAAITSGSESMQRINDRLSLTRHGDKTIQVHGMAWHRIVSQHNAGINDKGADETRRGQRGAKVKSRARRAMVGAVC